MFFLIVKATEKKDPNSKFSGTSTGSGFADPDPDLVLLYCGFRTYMQYRSMHMCFKYAMWNIYPLEFLFTILISWGNFPL
jgi:hypothetical protein